MSNDKANLSDNSASKAGKETAERKAKDAAPVAPPTVRPWTADFDLPSIRARAHSSKRD